MQTIWDPLRKKDVALTPEEGVRQWFIGVLRDSLGVPQHMMMSEVGFKFGQKQYRADILIYRGTSPLAVVECKRPEVTITEDVVRQALRYHAVLDVRCIILTNGKSTFAFQRGEGGEFEALSQIPSYNQL